VGTRENGLSAILYRSLTIARFWTLLEAHAAFTTIVTSARRITDTPEGWLRKLGLRSVGDFPHVHITMGDSFGGTGLPTSNTLPQTTFIEEPGGFGDDASDYWDEVRTADFKVRIYYENQGFDRQDELEMELMTAIEKGGRNLGYSAISGWGPWRGRRNGTAVVLTDEVARPVTEIVIPVSYQFTGAELKQ
jgi:hypothetical protein